MLWCEAYLFALLMAVKGSKLWNLLFWQWCQSRRQHQSVMEQRLHSGHFRNFWCLWSTSSFQNDPNMVEHHSRNMFFGGSFRVTFSFLFFASKFLWWISFDTLLAFFIEVDYSFALCIELKYQKYFCRSRIFYATLSATALRKYSSSTHFFAFSGLFQAWRKIDLPSAAKEGG